MEFEIYKRYRSLMSMEITVLKEKIASYWEKILKNKLFPEDRLAITLLIIKLENEILEKELRFIKNI